MILPVVRLTADWLEHATWGVNAYLASLARDVGDAAPANVTVIDETRDDRAAQGRQGELADGETDPGPIVGVYAAPLDDLIQTVATPVGYFTVGIVVRYSARNLSSADGRRDCYYTLRAVANSLRALSIKATTAERTRNDVMLVDMLSLAADPGQRDIAATDSTALVAATWQACDTTLQ